VVKFSEDDSYGEPRERKFTLEKLVRRKKKKTEDVPQISFLELLKLNIPDWPLVVLGVIGSAIIGVLFPMLAILFSGIIAVSHY